MAGRPQEVVKPLVKAMTVVLSNGASLRMLTPALKTKPFIATQDMFQHNTWSVKVKGVGPQEDDSKQQVDFSQFYKKFGLGE